MEQRSFVSFTKLLVYADPIGHRPDIFERLRRLDYEIAALGGLGKILGVAREARDKLGYRGAPDNVAELADRLLAEAFADPEDRALAALSRSGVRVYSQASVDSFKLACLEHMKKCSDLWYSEAQAAAVRMNRVRGFAKWVVPVGAILSLAATGPVAILAAGVSMEAGHRWYRGSRKLHPGVTYCSNPSCNCYHASEPSNIYWSGPIGGTNDWPYVTAAESLKLESDWGSASGKVPEWATFWPQLKYMSFSWYPNRWWCTAVVDQRGESK